MPGLSTRLQSGIYGPVDSIKWKNNMMHCPHACFAQSVVQFLQPCFECHFACLILVPGAYTFCSLALRLPLCSSARPTCSSVSSP